MIFYSGQNWYAESGQHSPSIQVIERKSESYDEYADRRERQKGAKRMPFGFAIAEPEEEGQVGS